MELDELHWIQHASSHQVAVHRCYGFVFFRLACLLDQLDFSDEGLRDSPRVRLPRSAKRPPKICGPATWKAEALRLQPTKSLT